MRWRSKCACRCPARSASPYFQTSLRRKSPIYQVFVVFAEIPQALTDGGRGIKDYPPQAQDPHLICSSRRFPAPRQVSTFCCRTDGSAHGRSLCGLGMPVRGLPHQQGNRVAYFVQGWIPDRVWTAILAEADLFLQQDVPVSSPVSPSHSQT